MSALSKLKQMKNLEEIIEKAGKANEILMAVAKEKAPGVDPQKTLEEMFQQESRKLLQPDTDYKTKLDLMATDLGAEHFAPLRANPNFQEIFEKWCQNFGERQYQKMLVALSEWSGGKATTEDVNALMQGAAAALQMQAAGVLD